MRKRIIFTGLGKSGCVARLIAEHGKTGGLDCSFEEPCNFEHGGFGAIGEGTLVVFVSKSMGWPIFETIASETVRRGGDIAAITENPDSFVPAGSAWGPPTIGGRPKPVMVEYRQLITGLTLLRLYGWTETEENHPARPQEPSCLT